MKTLLLLIQFVLFVSRLLEPLNDLQDSDPAAQNGGVFRFR